MKSLNRNVPMKGEFVRVNEVPYMAKALRTSIIKRSELENKYLKNKSYQNMKFYKKQKKTFAANYMKRKEKNFLLKLVHVK